LLLLLLHLALLDHPYHPLLLLQGFAAAAVDAA
jgi:hypothetical protein